MADCDHGILAKIKSARIVSGCRILLKKVKLAIRGAVDEAFRVNLPSDWQIHVQVYLISIPLLYFFLSLLQALLEGHLVSL